MDAIVRQIRAKMPSGLLGWEKEGGFPDPGIRRLPLDPMVGDEFGSFPDSRCLRREESHHMKVFGWLEWFRLQKRGNSVTRIWGIAILG